jgi:hypothetical protein
MRVIANVLLSASATGIVNATLPNMDTPPHCAVRQGQYGIVVPCPRPGLRSDAGKAAGEGNGAATLA